MTGSLPHITILTCRRLIRRRVSIFGLGLSVALNRARLQRGSDDFGLCRICCDFVTRFADHVTGHVRRFAVHTLFTGCVAAGLAGDCTAEFFPGVRRGDALQALTNAGVLAGDLPVRQGLLTPGKTLVGLAELRGRQAGGELGVGLVKLNGLVAHLALSL